MRKCVAQRASKSGRSIIPHLTLIFTLVRIVDHLHSFHGRGCFHLSPLFSRTWLFRTPNTRRVVVKCTLECSDEGGGTTVISYSRFILSSVPVLTHAK